MKTIFTLLMAVFLITASAQTVTNASTQVSATLTKLNATQATLSVKSLQGCTVDIDVSGGFTATGKYNSGEVISYTVPLSTSLFILTPQKVCGGGTAQPTSVGFTSGILPVIFETLTGAWSGGKLAVTVKGTLVDIVTLRIQQSTDGRDWATVATNFISKVKPAESFTLETPMVSGNIEGRDYFLLNKYLRLSTDIPIRKPIAGAVYESAKQLYVRLLTIDKEGDYTYSNVITVPKK